MRGLGSTLALFGLSCFGLTTFPCLDATHFGGSQSGEFLLVRFQVCIQSGKAIFPKKLARKNTKPKPKLTRMKQPVHRKGLVECTARPNRTRPLSGRLKNILLQRANQ